MGDRFSTVRIGAVGMVLEAAEKTGKVYYDRLFNLCEEVLPGCGCHVVLLPERDSMRPLEEQPLDGAIARRFEALAARHKLYLIAPLAERSGGRLYNTQCVISPAGEILFCHRKVHLAPGEDATTAEGDRFQTFDLPWFRAGIVICYDAMFPESTRCLALQGAQVVFLPSFGMEKTDPQNAARCLDNHIYLVTAGIVDRICGLPDSVFTVGQVLDPNAKVLVDGKSDQRIAIAELPLDPRTGKLLVEVKDNLLPKRRPATYGAIQKEAVML